MKKTTEDWEEIKRIYNFMCREGLLTLDLKEKDYSIQLKRRSPFPVLPQGAIKKILPVTELPTKKEENLHLLAIKTPLSGIFYRVPSPKTKPFVEPGQVVEKGQILCLIEAMKVMNEILAEERCQIEKILIENGQLVNCGEDIFFISPL